MISFGDELKRERELRGISLDQLARATKIGVRFLRAIDAGQVDAIPGEFYRRAYIRAYARYLGLDEEQALARYSFTMARPAPPPPAIPEPTARWQRLPLASAKWATLGLAGVVLSGAAAAVLRRSPEPTPAQVAAATSASTPPVTSGADRPGKLPFVSEELEAPETKEADLPSLKLSLKVEEPCWLEIRVDGSQVVEGLMLRGFQKEVEARAEICFSLGNAGGVSFWVNDQPGKPLGLPGQVRKNICITPENLTELVVS
jgi:cytoskeletal protein RodZ